MATDQGVLLEVQVILECHVCYDLFNNAIYQCHDGHVICQHCYASLSLPRSCPTCKIKYPTAPIRNKALELVASKALASGLVEGNPTVGTVGTPTTVQGQGVKRPLSGQGRRPSRSKPVITHNDIYCDGRTCAEQGKDRDPIKGIRFKCAECQDIDLCEDCMKEETHGHHLLIRITDPQQTSQVERALENLQNQPEVTGQSAAVPNWRFYEPSTQKNDSNIDNGDDDAGEDNSTDDATDGTGDSTNSSTQNDSNMDDGDDDDDEDNSSEDAPDGTGDSTNSSTHTDSNMDDGDDDSDEDYSTDDDESSD